MKKTHYFLAFDIGATSGRSLITTLKDGKFESSEFTRFTNPLVLIHGKYYWDIFHLFRCLKEALTKCAKENISIDSIGIDTWGVDFGYIGSDGVLLGLPRAYRDPYTNDAPENYFNECMSRKEVYDLTGIQIMNFNSLYQLYAAKKENFSPLSSAKEILFIPDLLSYLLTGEKIVEYTIASTSQIINPRTNDFEPALLKSAGIASDILRKPTMPGSIMGYLSDEIQEETGIGKIPVVAVTGHDTAAAVVAVPAKNERFAYLSSGTWSLMGIEVKNPIINEKSFELNFTNEGGINGTTRFLKNITGMWLLEQCRKEWAKEGREYTYPQIVEMAKSGTPFKRIVNPDDSSFATPTNMTKAIYDYCLATNQPVPETDADYIRLIFESLAIRYRQVIGMLDELSPFPIEILHVIGGGSKNHLLNQWTSDAIGRPVIAGPGEATAIGNFMVQAMALGCVKSLSEIREVIKNSTETTLYEPNNTADWKKAEKAFTSKIEQSH